MTAPLDPMAEAVAWAVTKDGGPVEDGRMWRHRDKAERFLAHASRSTEHRYELVPLAALARPSDTRRLDWLEDGCPMLSYWHEEGREVWAVAVDIVDPASEARDVTYRASTLRAAIDAAINAGAGQ